MLNSSLLLTTPPSHPSVPKVGENLIVQRCGLFLAYIPHHCGDSICPERKYDLAVCEESPLSFLLTHPARCQGRIQCKRLFLPVRAPADSADERLIQTEHVGSVISM